MEQQGGVYVVPVRFNDIITLSAIVDSGASDISIPADIVSNADPHQNYNERRFSWSANLRSC
jgi:hypothetical protein